LRPRQARCDRAHRRCLSAPGRRRARRPPVQGPRLWRPLRGARAVGTRRRRQRGGPRRPLGALAGARMGDHDDHHHPPPLPPVEARARALEELLTEKGIIHPDALDAVVTAYERDIGPMNGAKVVARAWIDPEYKRRLLADATAAIAELGFGGPEGEHMVVV